MILPVWAFWSALAIGADPDVTSVSACALPVFQAHRLSVDPEQPTTVDLSADGGPKNYLLVVASLVRSGRPSPLAVTMKPVPQPRSLPSLAATSDPAWQERVRKMRRRMQEKRQLAWRQAPTHSAARFAQQRSFYLFVGEQDFWDVGSYREVVGQLVAVGKHCLIYVDQDDSPADFPEEMIDEVVETFDERVLPTTRARLGHHRDVDRNGKFTILFTHWLDWLSAGKVSLGGFVRGGDFYRDVQPPFSNQCDMMYLNSKLRPGDHLRTLIAHEYAHAITFSEHVFGDYADNKAGEDEESWLNEAVSHVTENLAGRGWTNLDYRVSTFLSSPNSYRLVVPDYYREGLWRCHGSRGSTYLFLRYCVDRFGEPMLKELTQSNLRGTQNLEVATQTRFEELFRDWAVAICLDGLCFDESRRGFRAVGLRGKLGRRLLAGPRPHIVRRGQQTLSLAATGFCPMRVRVASGEAVRVLLESAITEQLQVTLVRLPDDLPLAKLEVETDSVSSSSLRQVDMTLRHEAGATVRWEHVSWEQETLPQTKAAQVRVGIRAAQEVFATSVSQAGQRLTSQSLAIAAPREPLIFKICGTDEAGRHVAAWGRLTAENQPAPLSN